VSGRLPPTAVEFYASLGADRSYQAVADHFGVSKRAVVYRATRENWQAQVAEIEAKAKQTAQQRAMESLEEMNVRHLKSLRVVQAKALETLRTMPLSSAMDAVRALDLGLKGERLVRGEPSDRSAVSVEDAIRREYSRWMTTARKTASVGAEE